MWGGVNGREWEKGKGDMGYRYYHRPDPCGMKKRPFEVFFLILEELSSAARPRLPPLSHSLPSSSLSSLPTRSHQTQIHQDSPKGPLKLLALSRALSEEWLRGPVIYRLERDFPIPVLSNSGPNSFLTCILNHGSKSYKKKLDEHDNNSPPCQLGSTTIL